MRKEEINNGGVKLVKGQIVLTLELIHINEMIDLEIDLMIQLRGTEISKVTAHTREVQVHLRINGVRVPQLVLHGCHHFLTGEPEENERHQRILIRR